MQGFLSLILHAHLPFVRHPEHPTFLEENWLFEAITETYVPLLRMLEGWAADRMKAPLTLTLSPTLCGMLSDPVLQSRYRAHLTRLIDLAEKETHRTLWEKPFHELAIFYLERFREVRQDYDSCQGDLLARFRALQESGQIEIATCAATHALLPLLADHPSSIRAQIQVACDSYRRCFGRQPEGIWLPECAYTEALDPFISEAGLRWLIVDTPGILQASPAPRYGNFAPILTPNGLAVFGRDRESAKQVWSRQEGYPGDPQYRDFYRDIGFDLDLDYVRPYLAAGDQRSFTGIKYHRISGPGPEKMVYEPRRAKIQADQHADHFLRARLDQIQRLTQIMDRPPILICPYDAELFGHWWYEGLEFLNFFVRKAYFDQKAFRLTTPGQFLHQHSRHQVAVPATSSWGEEGFWKVWLNETNHWIYPHLKFAQQRMTHLVERFGKQRLDATGGADTADAHSDLVRRALQQAARELLLAQASDWPFIMSTGTSVDYARTRVTDHLLRFTALYEMLVSGQLDETRLAPMESTDNLFPWINPDHFRQV